MYAVFIKQGQRPERSSDIKLAVGLIQISLFSSGNQASLGRMEILTIIFRGDC